MSSLLDRAFDLGRCIAQTSEYEVLQRAESAVRSDPEARNTVRDFQDLQQSLLRMQAQGHPLSPENLEQLKRAEDVAMSNSIVKEYYNSRIHFEELVDQVNTRIQEGIGNGSGQDPGGKGSCGCCCSS